MSQPAVLGRHGGTVSGPLISLLVLANWFKVLPPLPAQWELRSVINKVASNVCLCRSISMTLRLRSCGYHQSQMWRQQVSRTVAQAWGLPMCHCSFSALLSRFDCEIILPPRQPQVSTACSLSNSCCILTVHKLFPATSWSLVGQYLNMMQEVDASFKITDISPLNRQSTNPTDVWLSILVKFTKGKRGWWRFVLRCGGRYCCLEV